MTSEVCGGELNSKVHRKGFNFCIMKNLEHGKSKISVKCRWLNGCSLQKSRCFCECLKYSSNTGLIKKHFWLICLLAFYNLYLKKNQFWDKDFINFGKFLKCCIFLEITSFTCFVLLNVAVGAFFHYVQLHTQNLKMGTQQTEW